jgi:hypothetical protein
VQMIRIADGGRGSKGISSGPGPEEGVVAPSGFAARPGCVK